MEEAKYFIPLKIVLPNVPDERDQCVKRLLAMLDVEDVLHKVHVTKSEGEGGLCVHYNPDNITLTQVESLIRVAGAAISKHYRHKSFRVLGMSSPDAANTIEYRLAEINGVLSAKVSYSAQQLALEYDSRVINIATIQKELKKLGFGSVSIDESVSRWQKYREIILSLLAGGLLLMGWLAKGVAPTVSLALTLGSFAFGGYFAFRHSLHSLKQRRFDIDVLMVIAALGAGSLGAWGEGALLLFLFSLGHALEHVAMDKARHAVKALAKLVPKIAHVRRAGATEEVPVEALKLGDEVIVKPGDSIPADGEIVDGVSAVNQASITGESLPVDKKEGDTVFSGTINGEGTLTVKVTKLFNDTLINKMIRMVLEADSQRSPTERFTASFVKVFVPIVLIGVMLLIAVPLLFGAEWAPTFMRAMAVLVAASPCALAIGTPAAVLSGVACAARHGVLFKGGVHLENMGSITAVAFDKTGTLTFGKPEVKDIVAFDGDENEVLRLAASLEILSAHPLAKAVVEAAKTRGIAVTPAEAMTSVTGHGLKGVLEGKPIAIGNRRLFKEIPENVREAAASFEEMGHTMMLLQYAGEFVGMIGLADSARQEAKGIIASLQEQGIKKSFMLTGDNRRTAEAIAAELGITDVMAELLPENKVKAIADIEKQYHKVAMVGDGVNDAPAMTRATVGIAMGGAGSDVALEAADVALMEDDISKLPFAFRLGRASRRIIKQNLWIALGVVVLLVGATLTGVAGMGLAVLIHEGSSLLVVFNGLRLLGYKRGL